jgi:PTS system nitrogen regulatory IIA component
MTSMQLNTSLHEISVASILIPERTLYQLQITSKKKAFERIATTFNDYFSNDECDEIYDSMVTRERLGSTALGKGIAIPHCRMGNAANLMGSFLHLQDPIDFDSPDNQKVDLIFALVVPENDNVSYLNFIAKLAENFKDSNIINQLRKANSQDEVYKILSKL